MASVKIDDLGLYRNFFPVHTGEFSSSEKKVFLFGGKNKG